MAEPTTDMQLVTAGAESRIDSRLLARNLGTKHQSFFELVKNYRADFEEFGILRFKTGEINGRGQPEKFALLNEDQAYLALSYSRNTLRVRNLKVKLVKAFGEARRAAQVNALEYLPSYHALHDEIHALAAGSSHERHIHINVNRLVNKVVSIEAGQRGTAPAITQSLIVVAQSIAAKAMRSAADHHTGYQLAKESLQTLCGTTALETNHG